MNPMFVSISVEEKLVAYHWQPRSIMTKVIRMKIVTDFGTAWVDGSGEVFLEERDK